MQDGRQLDRGLGLAEVAFVPPQPAAVSATAATSTVHHPGRRRGYRRRGAACANCLLAMVIASRRIRSEPPARGARRPAIV